MSLTARQRSLVLAGAVLFLFGLVQGAAVQGFANPRLALSAHLTAVQSGLALMIAGVVWAGLSLPPRLETIARFTIIVGMFGLWVGLTLAAATGASEVLPIAGAGHGAGRTMEQVVAVLVLGSSGLMTLCWLLFVVGLIRAGRT